MSCTVVAEEWRADGSRVTRYAKTFDKFQEARQHAAEITPLWVDPNIHIDILVRDEEKEDHNG